MKPYVTENLGEDAARPQERRKRKKNTYLADLRGEKETQALQLRGRRRTYKPLIMCNLAVNLTVRLIIWLGVPGLNADIVTICEALSARIRTQAMLFTPLSQIFSRG